MSIEHTCTCISRTHIFIKKYDRDFPKWKISNRINYIKRYANEVISGKGHVPADIRKMAAIGKRRR